MNKLETDVAYVRGQIDTYIKNQDSINTRLLDKMDDNQQDISNNKADISNTKGKASMYGLFSGFLASLFMNNV